MGDKRTTLEAQLVITPKTETINKQSGSEMYFTLLFAPGLC
jgi:hypothetical protein